MSERSLRFWGFGMWNVSVGKYEFSRLNVDDCWLATWSIMYLGLCVEDILLFCIWRYDFAGSILKRKCPWDKFIYICLLSSFDVYTCTYKPNRSMYVWVILLLFFLILYSVSIYHTRKIGCRSFLLSGSHLIDLITLQFLIHINRKQSSITSRRMIYLLLPNENREEIPCAKERTPTLFPFLLLLLHKSGMAVKKESWNFLPLLHYLLQRNVGLLHNYPSMWS